MNLYFYPLLHSTLGPSLKIPNAFLGFCDPSPYRQVQYCNMVGWYLMKMWNISVLYRGARVLYIYMVRQLTWGPRRQQRLRREAGYRCGSDDFRSCHCRHHDRPCILNPAVSLPAKSYPWACDHWLCPGAFLMTSAVRQLHYNEPLRNVDLPLTLSLVKFQA